MSRIYSFVIDGVQFNVFAYLSHLQACVAGMTPLQAVAKPLHPQMQAPPIGGSFGRICLGIKGIQQSDICVQQSNV